MNAIQIPTFLKCRPRGNSYPSPKDMEFIDKIKKPVLPIPPKADKSTRSMSHPSIVIKNFTTGSY